MASKHLFVVTMQERSNTRCEREVFVRGDSRTAATLAKVTARALRWNPHNLWRAKAIGIRYIGEVL